MENAQRYEDEETAFREKLAVQTQNLFRRVTGKAEWKGMKVNTGKTKMLCISDALSFVPGSYIRPSEGSDKISSGGREDSMKLLGFRVSNRPGVAAHIEGGTEEISPALLGFNPPPYLRLHRKRAREGLHHDSKTGRRVLRPGLSLSDDRRAG